jgi:hypothetical protein
MVVVSCKRGAVRPERHTQTAESLLGIPGGPLVRRNCAYCGAPATTRDHIPPFKLFPTPRPSDLITVPACDLCNNTASVDDEYFVWAVTMSRKAQGDLSKKVLEQRLKSPLSDRRRRMVDALVEASRPVNLMSPGGVYLGRAVAYDVDQERLNAVITRCLRGLYFREYKARVPDDFLAEGYVEPPAESLDMPAAQALMNNRLRSVGGGVFEYWLAKPQPDWLHGVALCLMRFFGGLVAVGFVLPKEVQSIVRDA